MASNPSTVATMQSPSNSCCSQWQAECIKLSEGRTRLRNWLNVLDGQITSLETENLNLWNALEVLEEEKEKEESLRTSLEHEVAALKSKICLIETDVNCKNKELEKETLALRECISEKDGEIEQLKKLLAEENSGSVKGKKVFPSEKKKVAELQKNLKSEKSRADEACKLADAAKRKFEEDENLIETLNNEVKTISQKFEDKNKMFEAEKQKVVAEKKKVEEEKAKAKELRRIAEINEKRATDEKSHSNNLSTMLDVEKQNAEKLRKELHDFMSNEKSAISSQLDELGRNLELEKEKVTMQKKCADLENFENDEQKKAAETSMKKAIKEKRLADEFLQDLYNTRQIIEHLQQELTKVNHMLEAERLVSAKEKQRADDLILKSKEQQRIAAEIEMSQLDKLRVKLEAEKKNAGSEKKRADHEMSAKEELKKVAEANAKKAMEVKRHADRLSQDLEHVRDRSESLEVELNKVTCMLEAERLVLAQERNHADTLKSKLEEQASIASENEKRAMEEESRSNKIILELENARQKLRDMENMLWEVKQSRDLTGAYSSPPDLQEQLKFEKKRVKHYKEVAKLEKDLKSVLQQELTKVKQDFQSLLYQMDILRDTFGARNLITRN